MKLARLGIVVLALALGGCKFLAGGVLGDLLDPETAVCLVHPKYGSICVNAKGEVFYKTLIPPAAEKPQVDSWAREEAKIPEPAPVNK